MTKENLCKYSSFFDMYQCNSHLDEKKCKYYKKDDFYKIKTTANLCKYKSIYNQCINKHAALEFEMLNK